MLAQSLRKLFSKLLSRCSSFRATISRWLKRPNSYKRITNKWLRDLPPWQATPEWNPQDLQGLLASQGFLQVMSLILNFRDKAIREMVSPNPDISRDELAAEVRAYDRLHKLLWRRAEDAKTK